MITESGKGIGMIQQLTENHQVDESGNPAGGFTKGRGIDIQWQDGPLMTGDPKAPGGAIIKSPNGAFVEGVIAAAIGRLQHYNSTKFRCRENLCAITHLEEALHWLQARTADRQARGVEGTHQL